MDDKNQEFSDIVAENILHLRELGDDMGLDVKFSVSIDRESIPGKWIMTHSIIHAVTIDDKKTPL